MNYYWIKLKTDFFENDAIDFLLSQANGSEYVALYLKICTMTANTSGKLFKKIKEIIIPYDIKQIARDAKFFSEDTVRVALELYKNLGLIYQDENGILTISQYDTMVGSSKQDDHQKKLSAERQRRFRERKKQEALELHPREENIDENSDNVTPSVTVTHDVTHNDSVTVTQDITLQNTLHRNTDIKSLDIREKNININSISNKERGINTIGVTRNATEKEKNHARSYGKYKNVVLKNSEYEDLLNEYGSTLDSHIQILDEYIEQSGKMYKSCYLAMKKWVHKAYLERLYEKEGPNTNEKVQLDEKFYEKKDVKSEDEIRAETKRLQQEILHRQLN